MNQIDCDEYISHPQYWPNCVLEYYQWFAFVTEICEFENDRSKKYPQINRFHSIPYALSYWVSNLQIYSGIMMKVSILC